MSDREIVALALDILLSYKVWEMLESIWKRIKNINLNIRKKTTGIHKLFWRQLANTR